MSAGKQQKPGKLSKILRVFHPPWSQPHPNPQLGAVAVGAGSVLHSDQLVVLVIVLVITAKNDTVYMVNISYTQLYKLKLELIKIKTYLY